MTTTKTPRANVRKARAAANKPEGTQAPATIGIRYALIDYARPTSGRALAAHTAAFLTLSGMVQGRAIPRASMVRVIGPTAVKYHTGNGNFEATPDGVKLTPKGEQAFATRGSVDPELFKGFSEVFQKGTVGAVPHVKAEASRVKLDAPIGE